MMPSMAPATATATVATAAVATSGDADYAAIVARDARFDGRLFVGVTSTGVYCRPVCRVRTPLRRNCRFFGSAARAEAAGFRPCLRCRPELAPGLSLVDSPQALAQHAARLIDAAVGDGHDLYLPEVAARLGVTDRHLRRVFQQAHGVTPLAYLTTRRLLLAKQLLTDTPMPVTQVAHAAGFASLRRFNAAFAERYRLSPTRLRAERTEGGDTAGPAAPRHGPAIAATADEAALTVRLGYRPPYDIDGVLRFLRDRALPGVEAVDGLEWRRTLAWCTDGGRQAGWVAARFVPDRHEVHLRVPPVLMPVLGAVVQRLRQGLDLDADPALIDPVLATVPAPPRPGVRVPNGLDGFEVAARVILGQQVTVAAARTLTRRLVEALGEPVATPHADLGRLFPSPAAIAAADADAIGRLGIVRQRVRALQALAAAVQEGRVELHRGAPLQATLDSLRALPGIGEWSAQLIAMRALAWPDAFPASDIGLLNALGTRDVAAVEAMAEAWRPWRAYAVIRLWQTLETGT
jgi:AraC family transcriptional regulator of adaptative response / DNA-3-methyladenine glycosylase II